MFIEWDWLPARMHLKRVLREAVIPCKITSFLPLREKENFQYKEFSFIPNSPLYMKLFKFREETCLSNSREILIYLKIFYLDMLLYE